jgi:hypothetical protein
LGSLFLARSLCLGLGRLKLLGQIPQVLRTHNEGRTPCNDTPCNNTTRHRRGEGGGERACGGVLHAASRTFAALASFSFCNKGTHHTRTKRTRQTHTHTTFPLCSKSTKNGYCPCTACRHTHNQRLAEHAQHLSLGGLLAGCLQGRRALLQGNEPTHQAHTDTAQQHKLHQVSHDSGKKLHSACSTAPNAPVPPPVPEPPSQRRPLPWPAPPSRLPTPPLLCPWPL